MDERAGAFGNRKLGKSKMVRKMIRKIVGRMLMLRKIVRRMIRKIASKMIVVQVSDFRREPSPNAGGEERRNAIYDGVF